MRCGTIEAIRPKHIAIKMLWDAGARSISPILGVHFTVRRPKLSIRRPIFNAQICI